MEFEWDEAKRFTILRKHGVDFVVVEWFDWRSLIETEDVRKPYGETRWRALGQIGDRLNVLIYTRRYGRVRVISLRSANRKEHAEYEASSSDLPDT